MLIRVPFSTTDLEGWKRVAKEYQNDLIGVTKHFQFVIKRYNPDWNDIQLLLEYMMETEKQLILKTAADLAEEHYKVAGGDVKEYLPLQDPNGTQIGQSTWRGCRPIRGGFRREWRGPFPRP